MDFKNLLDELCERWRKEKLYSGLSLLTFSKWVLWKDRDSLTDINQVGVYTLGKFDRKELVPVKVDPLDKNIIYFGKTNTGKTTSFRNRLGQFDKEAFGEGGYHSGGSNYKQIFSGDATGLYVSICPVTWVNVDDIPYDIAQFSINQITTRLEVCLRGLYVYKWGRLPRCNKE